MGTCRFLSNLYQVKIEEAYQNGDPFPSPADFYKWINEKYIPINPDKIWIKDTHSKTRKQTLVDKQTAYQRFFKGQGKHPRFKKKKVDECSYYFVRNDQKSVIHVQRHRIKVPGLGYIRFKEKGYIPSSDSSHVVRSGRITMYDDRFYISVLMEIPDEKIERPDLGTEGMGIDVGLKTTAVCSNGMTFENIERTDRVKKLKKQLRHAQRNLSRKYEALKKQTGCDSLKKVLKTTGYHANIEKAKRRIAHLQARLARIRKNYRRYIASKIAKTKPSYVTLERLNVQGMMKNRHLARSVVEQGFYELKTAIIEACKKYQIEVREVSMWYASSKTCHMCGHIHHDLKLSDRIYVCPKCGYTENRDMQAALNLRDQEKYTVIA